ncbi:MAG: ABC transporter ATP-binding protein [Nitrospira sp. SB0677_bin_15]|nr:ABC transporter ATP-binding protein [Nitrospira sp. SB0667_bin_9]MYD30251.1 ABC transporter ATP-binding protein [Nitrospira sp. SB0661_bin_20]MYG39655.1 ABC transporter ATP-binding protein [Nitrospira sp. SB0677_bin_15]MYH02084.1 ABC transporter ATP-binding protein [Nitrospira sp. SB0675_bin_23]MYJ23644.1 ABC transporter ATP-binding protein [Nitrospira sp. SB0673_bin_12]
MSFLSIDHLSKYFPSHSGNGTVCIFEDVTVKINKGEFVTVIGHSGCGKSTLLNIIAGLETPTEGGAILNGQEVTGPGLDRMVVFQSFALMPWMTVFENVALAVRSAYPTWSSQKIKAHVQKYITLVSLQGAETKKPAALSGGMKQRVGLARAFSIEPKVLLLDEPFAQIDALTRGVIQEELVQMWNATRNTVFMVTHDVDEAILLSDRIMLMTNGPSARIAEIVDVTIPRPRSRETIIEDEHYYKIRNHIIHFLVRHASHGQADESGDHTERSGPVEIHFRTQQTKPVEAALCGRP